MTSVPAEAAGTVPRASSPDSAPGDGATVARFPLLDTLRALGALAVMTTHCAFSAGSYLEWGAFGRALARLDSGVALFFVLSGFLLSRPWFVAAVTAGPPPEARTYYWKRTLRVVPAYVVTALVALLVLSENDGRDLGGWVQTFTLTDIYRDRPPAAGLSQTWSLATEIAFYVALPLLMLLALGRRPRRVLGLRVGLVLALMVVVNLVWLGDVSGRIDEAGRHVNEWLPAYLTWFAAGIGLAWVQVCGARATGLLRRVHDGLRGLAAMPGTCWVAAVGLLLVAGTPVAGPTLLVPATEGEAIAKNLLYVVVATLIVVPGIWSLPSSGYHRVLAHPALRHLGKISYSFFLIHMTVLHLVMTVTGYELFDGHLLQIWLLTLVASWAASELLYRYVEVPALRLRRLVRGPATSSTAAKSATSTR